MINSIRRFALRLSAAFRPAEPLPAHCGNIHALVLHLCDNDRELCKWVLRWIAYPLRHPGAKMETGLIINGPSGTGKSLMFVNVVARLYLHQAVGMHAERLNARFTPWDSETRLVVVDGEGEFDKADAARLKSLIASDVAHIQKPGRTGHRLRNKMNFIYLSGAVDFLPLDRNDRRFTIVECPPPLPTRYYQAIHAEIENGGIEAFRHYLTYGLDMGNFGPHTPPPCYLNPPLPTPSFSAA